MFNKSKMVLVPHTLMKLRNVDYDLVYYRYAIKPVGHHTQYKNWRDWFYVEDDIRYKDLINALNRGTVLDSKLMDLANTATSNYKTKCLHLLALDAAGKMQRDVSNQFTTNDVSNVLTSEEPKSEIKSNVTGVIQNKAERNTNDWSFLDDNSTQVTAQQKLNTIKPAVTNISTANTTPTVSTSTSNVTPANANPQPDTSKSTPMSHVQDIVNDMNRVKREAQESKPLLSGAHDATIHPAQPKQSTQPVRHVQQRKPASNETLSNVLNKHANKSKSIDVFSQQITAVSIPVYNEQVLDQFAKTLPEQTNKTIRPVQSFPIPYQEIEPHIFHGLTLALDYMKNPLGSQKIRKVSSKLNNQYDQSSIISLALFEKPNDVSNDSEQYVKPKIQTGDSSSNATISPQVAPHLSWFSRVTWPEMDKTKNHSPKEEKYLQQIKNMNFENGSYKKKKHWF